MDVYVCVYIYRENREASSVVGGRTNAGKSTSYPTVSFAEGEGCLYSGGGQAKRMTHSDRKRRLERAE